MNKQQYRIVFNKARGQYMAVAEVARAQGKDSGNTIGTVVRKALLGVISLNLALSPLVSQMAHAQIVADPSAPGTQRPTVLAAPNGVPVVNIQTPSAAGVSRNTYSQFDVNQAGAILNNSRSNVQSQQGGWIQGNPWLARGEARIILNEVNSANPSQIKGYLEVAGQRAELVIANPAGINVDGGGFINASRAILTTGTPQFGTGGSLDGYRVERGTVTINGKGLDASLVDYTGILARAAQVNAGIWTKELGLVLGNNTVSAAAGQNGSADVQTVHAPASTQPQFALDVSQLGGMYAGKISLVGTDAGVGVRNAGAIGASAGQVQISADGLLTNSGTISTSAAGQHISIDTQGRGLENSGTIASQGNVQMVNNGATRNSGTVNAARELRLNATELDNSQGTLTAARLDITANNLTNTQGKISQTGLQDLGITASAVNNTHADGQAGVIGAIPLSQSGTAAGDGSSATTPGTGANASSTPTTSMGASTAVVVTPPETLAAGRIAIANQISNAGGEIVANGATDLATSQSLTNSGTMQLRNLSSTGALDNSAGTLSAQNMRLQLDQFSNVAGTFYSQNSLDILAQNLNNAQGSIATGGGLNANVQQGINNQGGMLAAQGDIRLGSQTLGNSASNGKAGTISSNAGSIAISATDSLTNSGGVIQTVGTGVEQMLLINTAMLNNAAGKMTQGGNGTMAVTASQSLGNSQGQIISNGALTLNAGVVHNSDGTISALQDITAHTASLDNSRGKLLAQKALTVNSTGSVTNSAGQISANDALQLTSASLTNDQQGQIGSSNGSTTVTTGALNNQSGSLLAKEDIRLSTLALDNSSGQISGGTVAIDSHQQNLTNTLGKIISTAGASSIQSGALVNHGGVIQAAGTLNINTHEKSLSNAQQGLIASTDNAQLATGTLDNSTGRIQAGGTAAATATTPEQTLLADISISASGPMQNVGGMVEASRNVDIAAQGLDNSQGSVLAANALTVQSADAVRNSAGKLLSNGQVRVTSRSLINDQQGQIGSSNSSVAIDTGALNNQTGTIASASNILLGTQQLDNTSGQISGATVVIDSHQQTVTNVQGRITATTGAIELESGALFNQGGLIQAKQQLSLNTHNQMLVNADTKDVGGLLSGSDLILKTGAWNNINGNVQSAATVQARASSLDNSAGKILAGKTLNLATTDALVNTSGQIAATEAVTVHAGSITNTAQGQIGSVTDAVVLNTGSFDNQTGVVMGSTSLRVDSQTLNNAQGTLSAGTTSIDTHQQRLNNNAGTIAATTGALSLSSGVISNQTGTMFAADALRLVGTGNLDNTQGKIASYGNAYLNVDGFVLNRAGVIQTGQDTPSSLELHSAGGIDNSAGGSIGSLGTLTVTSGGALQNVEGSIVSNSDVSLQVAGLDNKAGRVSANTVHIESRNGAGDWQAVNNQGGNIAANQTLTIESGRLDNSTGGSIATTAAGSSMTVVSHGQDIVNQQSGSAGGILAAGSLQVDAQGGRLDNGSAGYIGAAGRMDLVAASIQNQSGTIAADSDISLRATAVSGTGIDNSSGTIQAKGSDITITAGATDINNGAGNIVADQNLAVTTTGSINNQQGKMTAGQVLAISDSARVTNTGGTLHAGELLALRNTSVTGDGKLLSDKDLELALRDSYTLATGGQLSANGQLTLSSQGDIVNQGNILGGTGVSVSAVNVDNQAGASITSAGTTRVSASNTLTNRGLIDGADTQISAGTVNNVGSGRIYGDRIAIRAGTVNNTAEVVDGVRQSATIAAREALNIGTLTLNNNGGATLLSLGDLNVAAGIDSLGVASLGQAVAINNHGASIESMGNMRLNALDVNNTNANLTVTPHVLQSSERKSDMFAPPGEEPQDAKWFREVGGSVGMYKIANPDLWGIYHAPAYTAEDTYCSGGDSGVCTTTPAYYEPRTSSRYAEFGVTPPPAVAAPKPTVQQYGGITFTIGGFDGESSTIRVIWPQGSDKAGYDAALEAYYADQQAVKDAAVALQNVISAVNAENNRTTNQYRDYVYIGGVSESIYRDAVASSDPGRISVGGNLTVQGNLNNIDSSVIAGGAISVSGGTLNNQSTQGVQSTETSGTAYSIHWEHHGGFRDSQERQIRGVSPYSNLSTITFNLPTTVYLQYTKPQLPKQVDANANSGQNVQINGGVAAGVDREAPGTSTQGAAGPLQGQAAGVTADLRTSTAAGVSSTAVASGATDGPRASQPIEVQLTNASASGSTIARTVAPAASLPSSSLFVIHAGNGNMPLVETDPRFTNYRQWLSSDYMLQALAIDPALSQKRMGDGFYEQQLIRDQVAQLTGRRFIGDFRSDDEQYKALMDAGVTFGKAHGIRPGIGLTQEQIAQLTSDIVWLVEREASLADGSRQKVLVPQVYVVTRAGDVMPDGALISGDSVHLNLRGDAYNQGTIAGRKVVSISADNIHNVSGRISGDAVGLQALNDINVIGATVQARSALIADAGRDLNVRTTTSTNAGGDKDNGFSSTVIDRVAGLYLDRTATDAGVSNSGLMLLTAGHNVNLAGAVIGNAQANSNTVIQAGNDLNVGTVATGNQQNIRFDSRNHLNWGESREVGSVIATAGNAQLSAGNDVNARATQVLAGEDLSIQAARDIHIGAGVATRSLDDAYYRSGSSLFGSSSLTLKNTVQSSEAITSDIAGRTVNMHAGNNLNANATTVSATEGGLLSAGNNVTLGTAENTRKEYHFEHSTSSGLSLSGWSSSQSTSTDTLDAVRHTGSVASTVGGNIVVAGNLNGAAATQTDKGIVSLAGSTVRSEQGMAVVSGNHVVLDAVRDSEQSTSAVQSSSTAFSPWQIAATKKGTSDSRQETTTLQGSSVQGGNGAAVIASGAVLGQAANLQAGAGKLLVQGATVDLRAGLNSDLSHTESTFKKSGVDTISDNTPGKGINYKSQGTQDHASTSLVPTTLGGSAIEIRSTAGDLSLAGVQVKDAGTPVTLATAGKLNLDVVQTTDQQSSSGKASDLVWQSVRGSGHVDETTHYNQLGSNVTIIAPQITAQMSVKDSAQALAQQPGLQWMGQLTSNSELAGKVNWQQVQQAHEQWNYKQQGLSPAAAAVVAIVVAYFTAGAGTSLATSAGMTTTAGSATASGVAAAGAGVAGSGVAAGTVLTTTGAVVAQASGAAISTLASKAAVSLINNGGDLGKTLNDLGSSESVKQLAAAALTGGALAGLNASMGWDKPASGTTLDWTDKLGRSLSNNLADASIKSALGQGKLEDNLRGAIVGAVGASLANAVGDLSTGDTAALNTFGNKVAHALVGCGMGAAMQGGSKGCGAGALGAVIAEATAELYNAGGSVKPFTKEIGQIAAIVAAAATGEDVNTAQLAGANAVVNNFLSHAENQLRKQAKAQCDAGIPAACSELERLNRLDKTRDSSMYAACSSAPASRACQNWILLAEGALASYSGKPQSVQDELRFRELADRYQQQRIRNLIDRTPHKLYLSEQQKNVLMLLGSVALDFTPVAGDIKGFVEAESPFDYTLAIVGMAGPVGDGVKVLVKQAQKLYEANKLTDATQALIKASSAANSGRVFEGNLADVWKQTSTVRGNAIESHLAATEYKDWFNVGQLNNGKFPLVDFQKGNTLVSVKSVDTRGSTWVTRMQDHIYDLGRNGATINGTPANMVLDIRVQPGGLQSAQPLINYGRQNGVAVVIKEFK